MMHLCHLLHLTMHPKSHLTMRLSQSDSLMMHRRSFPLPRKLRIGLLSLRIRVFCLKTALSLPQIKLPSKSFFAACASKLYPRAECC